MSQKRTVLLKIHKGAEKCKKKVQKKSLQIRKWSEKCKKGTLKKIEESHEKSNWMNVSSIIVNILALGAYRSMDKVLAKYEGMGTLYTVSLIAMIVLVIICVWELLCCLGVERIHKIMEYFRKVIAKLSAGLRTSKKKFALRLLVVFAVIGGVVFTAYNMYYPSEYYASVNEVYGIPTGAGEKLSGKERSKRAEYWKVKRYIFRKHITLINVNAYDQTDIMQDYSSVYQLQLLQKPARIEVDYKINEDKYHSYGQDYYRTAEKNDFKEPKQVSYYNSSGKLLLELSQGNNDDFEINAYSSEDLPQILNSTILKMPQEQSDEDDTQSENMKMDMAARKIEVTYNSAGLPQERRIWPYVYNLYGINGERYTYDRRNRLSSICYLDVNGDPVCNKKGIMLITFQYDDKDNLHGIRYFKDEEGKEKIEGFYGVFCETLEYDEYGNLIMRKQKDRSENWCYDENGVYSYNYTYKNGMLINEQYHGLNDNLTLNKNLQCSSLTFHMKKRLGRRTISVCFDLDSTESEETGIGNVKMMQSVPAMSSQVEDKLESSANHAIQAKDDAQDSALIQKNSESTRQNGQKKVEDLDFANGQELIRYEENSRRYAQIRYEVKHGCIVELSYRDKEGNLVENENGCAIQRFAYDEDKRIKRESYLDANGKGKAVDGGFAGIEKIYESGQGGRLIQIRYLDVSGKLATNQDLGYAQVHYDFEDAGGQRKIEESYWDCNENPVRLPELGYTAVERQYNDRGFLVRETYHNNIGEGAIVCRQDYGVAEIIYDYSDSGDLILEAYRTKEGNPTNRRDTGYAVIHQQFENGKLKQKWYDGYRNQELMKVIDKTTGIAMIEYDYENGQVAKEKYLDIEGKPATRTDTGYAQKHRKYTEKGLIEETSYHAVNGSLVLEKEYGFAKIALEYDDFGRQERITFYNAENKPAICKKYQCAGYQYQYDDQGNVEMMQYLGVNGELMIRKDYGIAQVINTHDSFGNLTKQEYLDEKGQPAIEQEYGYASFERFYEDGKCERICYYGIDKKLKNLKNSGYAMITFERNSQGQVTLEHYYDEKEQPVICTKYHCAARKFDYDKRGNQTDVWYLDLDEKVMSRNDQGYAHCIWEYDDAGNTVKTAYFDTKDKPAVYKDGGYSYSISEYDVNGN